MILEETQSLLVAGRSAYGTPPVGPFAGIGAVWPAASTTPVAIRGGVMPNAPDTMIGLYDATGFEPERTMGRLIEVVNLHVLVRAVKAVDAETLAHRCFNILDTFKGTLLGVEYYGIMARTKPFSIGPDENSRMRYSCNYRVTKARS